MNVEKINGDLEIVRLPCFDMPPRFLWFQLQNFKTFNNLFKKYTVLHIVNPEAGATTAYLGKKLKISVVTSIHGVYLYPLRKMLNSPFRYWTFNEIGLSLLGFPLHSLLYDVCLKLSDRIAVCSASTVAELKTIHPSLTICEKFL